MNRNQKEIKLCITKHATFKFEMPQKKYVGCNLINHLKSCRAARESTTYILFISKRKEFFCLNSDFCQKTTFLFGWDR